MTTASEQAAIGLEGVTFRYGPGDAFALRVESLAVAPGEKVAVIGPSGSGKSTLLGLMAGIIEPEAGRVTVGEEEISGAPDAARRRVRIATVGLIFQEFELLEYLTVRDNILLPFYIHPANKLTAAIRERAEKLATAVGLAGKLGRGPARLSHGERQRVAICRALITEPAVLLADEPTGNLDPKTSRQILDLMIEQAGRLGGALVMVTHDHGLLERFDRVIDVAAFSSEAGT